MGRALGYGSIIGGVLYAETAKFEVSVLRRYEGGELYLWHV
jgi:hypothetical protein